MFDLVAVFTKVASAIDVAEELAADFKLLYPYVVQIADLGESTFATQSGQGATKLASALAAGKAMAAQFGIVWSTGLAALITKAIAAGKAVWNALTAVVTEVKTDGAVSLATQAAALASAVLAAGTANTPVVAAPAVAIQ